MGLSLIDNSLTVTLGIRLVSLAIEQGVGAVQQVVNGKVKDQKARVRSDGI
jgi:hypothetical protein